MRKNTVVTAVAFLVATALYGCDTNTDIEVRPKDQFEILMTGTEQTDEPVTEITAAPETEAETTVSEVTSLPEETTAEKTEAVTKSDESSSSDSSSGNEDRSSGNSSSEDKSSGNSSQNSDRNESHEAETPKQTEQPSPSPEPSPEPAREYEPAPVIDNTELKYVDGILIVNKSYPVPQDFVPSGLVLAYGSREEYILPETNEAFKQMCIDAAAEGLNLWCQSGYRSVSTQDRIYNNYVARDGKAAADTYSARPGHSEHHTGLCFDLNTISSSFAYTAEGKWVAENSWKYGLIIRYPEGKEDITGYKYEPWHLRYVGTELAAELYNSGLCIEEYFGLTSCYND